MKIVVIIGPTGVGKTKLSIHLAKKMNAEIINADSTQIYKEVSVGVAKVTKEEMCGIKHHMLSTVSILDNYTVKDYQTDARKILDDLIKKDKNVIIVGGSGLYVKALLYDYKFTDEEKTFTYDGISNEELKKRVDEIYKENDIHVNNRKRLVRFLSHYDETHEIIKNSVGKDTPLYDFTLIALTTDRESLYYHLDIRVEEMICDGLLEETKEMMKIKSKKALSLIGYREFMKYYNHEIPFLEAINITKKRTRDYAKRQYTFLRNQFKDIKWFNTDYDNFNNTIKEVEDYLASI